MLSLDLFPKTPNMNDGTIYLQISCLPLIITFYSCTMHKSEHGNCNLLPELRLVHHCKSECLSPTCLVNLMNTVPSLFLKRLQMLSLW